MHKFIDSFEEWIAQAALCVVALCVFSQVICRYVFGIAITWTEELAGFAMVWAVYMGAAMAVRDRFHLRILVVINMLERKPAIIFVIIGDILWLIFCSIMLVAGWEYVSLLWERHYISPSLGIDQKWPQSIVFIGYILIVARAFQVYFKWIKGGYKGLPGIMETEPDVSSNVERRAK